MDLEFYIQRRTYQLLLASILLFDTKELEVDFFVSNRGFSKTP